MSARKTSRASFGTVRKLPSGRYQARYPEANGQRVTAPTTFATKRDALDWLAGVRADKMRGQFRDHRAGSEVFGPYATDWIENGGSRGRLAPKTRANNEDLLAGLLSPLHDYPLNTITPAIVRAWYSRARKDLAATLKLRAEEARRKVLETAKRRGIEPPEAPPIPTGESRLRQAYTLLRSILQTAVRDGLIGSNPCQIVGAGSVAHPERPYMTPEALAAIVNAMPEQWTLPIRVMFGAHLRVGELVALQRGDYAGGVLRVERQTIRVRGEFITTATKTGNSRSVALPPRIAAEVEAHLATTSGFGKSPLFPRADGEAITGNALGQAWRKAARSIGLGHFHVHDVRHAGLTMAAQGGATTRELMARAGHSTARAALIYQHVAEERNVGIAATLDTLAGVALEPRVLEAKGTGRARTGLEAVIRVELTADGMPV